MTDADPEAPRRDGPTVESIEIEGVRVTAPASEFHSGARRLGRGLILYGLVGCVLGALGLLVAAVLLARMVLAGADVLPHVNAIAATIDITAQAMDDAATTSRGAATTIETTMPSVSGLADTVDRTGPTLGRMGETLQSFSILGSQPLVDAGTQFVQLSADLKDLGPQLRGLANGLTPNAVTLRASAASFTRLAAELRAAHDTLEGGVVQDSVATVLAATLLLIVALIAWVLVPAVGALVLGVWLLRRVAPHDLPRRLRGPGSG
ncbi:MAG TPA: hypothetical protein VF802_04665 [Candidatus Limnocylindrales bacterium]